MSSTTLDPSRRGAQSGAGDVPARRMSGTSAGPGPSFLRVLNSEFIKFRTLLSTSASTLPATDSRRTAPDGVKLPPGSGVVRCGEPRRSAQWLVKRTRSSCPAPRRCRASSSLWFH